ncbi:unnamed protein product [Oreochromis niloticus]|nr:unnamed protein product [Mustela putorius furo]
MSITGNLSQRDCTTLFSNLTTNYTDKYFFRVESEPFKATAQQDPLQITVRDSYNKIEENTDGSFTTKIQQTITLSDTHDGKKISCSARYPVNQGKDTKTAETEETLSVSCGNLVGVYTIVKTVGIIMLLVQIKTLQQSRD